VSTAQGVGRGEVERALKHVFARPEFGEEEETLLDQFLEWLRGLFDVDADPAQAVDAAGVFVNVLLALAALALLVLLARALFARYRAVLERRRRAAAELEGHHERIRALYRAARAARAEGDLARALRLSLFALVAGLGQRGEIEYRDAWTYREIVRNGAPGKDVRELLARLVDELESKNFGRAPITPEDVLRLEELCRAHLPNVLEGEAA
jgi:hypothetical protein